MASTCIGSNRIGNHCSTLCGEARRPLSHHRRTEPTDWQAVASFSHSQLRNEAASMPFRKPSRKSIVDFGFMSLRRAGRRHSRRRIADGKALSSFPEHTRAGTHTLEPPKKSSVSRPVLMITSRANANAGVVKDSSVGGYHTAATHKSWWWFQVEGAVNESIKANQTTIRTSLRAFRNVGCRVISILKTFSSNLAFFSLFALFF